MGQVLQLGRLAETEAQFTAAVCASLLLWHWGYLRNWPAWFTWSLGGALAAFAGLIKGPQGPIYFFAATWCYLAVMRDWRYLFSRAHAVGLMSFACVLTAWQLPYYLQTDLACVRGIWADNASLRFEDILSGTLAKHMATFPVELFVCMLPWSPALLLLASRRFRDELAGIRSELAFLVTALAVSFPTVWLAPGAQTRYYMPLYPVIGLLVGAVIEKGWQMRNQAWLPRVAWLSYTIAMGILLLTIAGAVAAAGFLRHEYASVVAQPWPVAILLLALACSAAALLMRSVISTAESSAKAAVLSVAAFLAVGYVVIVLNVQYNLMENQSATVYDLKSELPEDVRLVSLGVISHSFRYHYRNHFAREIPIVEINRHGRTTSDEFEYFCFNNSRHRPRELPFAWEPVAEISVDRQRKSNPDNTVIVGRRTGATRTAHRDQGDNR